MGVFLPSKVTYRKDGKDLSANRKTNSEQDGEVSVGEDTDQPAHKEVREHAPRKAGWVGGGQGDCLRADL